MVITDVISEDEVILELDRPLIQYDYCLYIKKKFGHRQYTGRMPREDWSYAATS